MPHTYTYENLSGVSAFRFNIQDHVGNEVSQYHCLFEAPLAEILLHIAS
jgi:hypothetical protein